MKSIMTHDFATTPQIGINRSRFDMSCGHKTTGDAGWLIPVFWMPIIAGDTISVNMSAFARLNTPLHPYMDNAFIDTHWFSVSDRILWQNFRKFMGEQENPGDSIDYTIPVLEGAQVSDGSKMSTPATNNERAAALMNYIGVPHGVAPDDVEINALPFRAYSRIYNEWFRDQNIIDSHEGGMIVDDGPDDMDISSEQHLLQRRGKRMDYVTQGLPWPQKGDAVSLPLGTTAPVTGLGVAGTPTRNLGPIFHYETDPLPGKNYDYYTDTADPAFRFHVDNNAPYEPKIFADLSNATAATVNELRQAFQIQKLLERDARAGTRFPEVLKNHFSVNYQDQTYRPEFLGSNSSPLNVNPVAATADNSGLSPTSKRVGALGAFVTSANTNHGFTKSFQEPGIIMCILSIRADLTYQKGLSRHLSKQTRYDYFWPSLAHLGEQSLLSKEVYCDGTAGDDDVFAYVPRYDEYRFNQSRISGLFQSDNPSSLDAWHLSQDFSTRPVLSQSFIEENPPFDRIVAVNTEPHFIIDTYFDIKAARPVPVNGVPGMIDHF